MVKWIKSATAIAVDSSIAIDALVLGFVPESFAVSATATSRKCPQSLRSIVLSWQVLTVEQPYGVSTSIASGRRARAPAP
jgi:hypothetical protein